MKKLILFVACLFVESIKAGNNENVSFQNNYPLNFGFTSIHPEGRPSDMTKITPTNEERARVFRMTPQEYMEQRTKRPASADLIENEETQS